MMSKTIKIRLKYPVASTEFDYLAGQEVDAPEEIAKDLIQAGHAELVGGKQPERAVSFAASSTEKR